MTSDIKPRRKKVAAQRARPAEETEQAGRPTGPVGRKRKLAGAKPTADSPDQQSTATSQPSGLEELQASLAQLVDVNIRLQAEVQNVSRRAALDVEKAHKFGLVSFVTALLETVDNLEKALASFDPSAHNTAVYEGIKLTHQSLVKTLKKFSITAIDPVGEPFNPEFHEALGKVKSKKYTANTVVTVVQKGYMLNERLLRAAKILIAE